MSDQYYVIVLDINGQDVHQKLGPFTKAKADSLWNQVNASINSFKGVTKTIKKEEFFEKVKNGEYVRKDKW